MICRLPFCTYPEQPHCHRDHANSITQIIGSPAGIIEPIIGSLLYTVIGVVGVLIIDFVTFFVAVAVVSQVHIPQPKQSQESRKGLGNVWREMRLE